mmetsp:Transcript_14650/g.33065  ORF Transcript_14650/g.33065 Transcript_14650/m.33065 type:complete len:211 (+) Transcript_14650:332-964(+)
MSRPPHVSVGKSAGRSLGTRPCDVCCSRWTGRAADEEEGAGLSALRLFLLGSRSDVDSDDCEFRVPRPLLRPLSRLLGRYAPSTALSADRPRLAPDEGGTRTFSYRPLRTPETSYDGGSASGLGLAAAFDRRPFGLDMVGAMTGGALEVDLPPPPPLALPAADLPLLPPVRPLPFFVDDEVTFPTKLSGGPASLALPYLFPSASRHGIGA